MAEEFWKLLGTSSISPFLCSYDNINLGIADSILKLHMYNGEHY